VFTSNNPKPPEQFGSVNVTVIVGFSISSKVNVDVATQYEPVPL